MSKGVGIQRNTSAQSAPVAFPGGGQLTMTLQDVQTQLNVLESITSEIQTKLGLGVDNQAVSGAPPIQGVLSLANVAQSRLQLLIDNLSTITGVI